MTGLHTIVCLSLLLFPFLFFGCGSYHAPPSPPPALEQSLWTSPQIPDTQHIKVSFIPQPKTVTFDAKDIGTDLQFLFDDYKQSTSANDKGVEEFSVQIPEPESYVLVIQKTTP